MSQIVKEVITDGIDYYSPPLKKHRYSMSSVERRPFISNGSPSGLLMEYIQERDRAYSGILNEGQGQDAGPSDNDVQAFSDFLQEVEDSDTSDDTAEDADVKVTPKRRFRNLNKRIETLIYDDTAVKQGELEDEAFDLLNEDGFYDEVLPMDYEEDNKPESKFPLRSFLLYSGALALLVGIIIVWVKLFLL